MRSTMLKGENVKALTRLLLIFSAIGFFFLFAMFVSNSPLLYLGVGNIGVYSSFVLTVVLVFPLSIGLSLSAKNWLNRPIVTLLLATVVTSVLVFVPAIAVQKPYVEHCFGTYPEWQSLSYHFFGVGSHFDLAGCQ